MGCKSLCTQATPQSCMVKACMCLVEWTREVYAGMMWMLGALVLPQQSLLLAIWRVYFGALQGVYCLALMCYFASGKIHERNVNPPQDIYVPEKKKKRVGLTEIVSRA